MKYLYAFCFLFTVLIASAQNSTYVVENFDYESGIQLSLTSGTNWFAHSGIGNNPIAVSETGLSFASYVASGIGNAALVNNNGEDINKPFNENVSSGVLYTSFLVNVDSEFTSDGQGFFFHYGFYSDNLTPNESFSNVSTAFRARTHISLGSDPENTFKLGLSFNTGTPTEDTEDLNIGETYLVVVKYQFIEGDLNDEVSLYVFAEGDDFSVEPENPTLGPFTGSQADAAAIQNIVLRQFNDAQNLIVDGLVTRNFWDIQFCEPDASTETLVACNEFTWINDITYTESNNTATVTLTNAAGCDSLVTLNLTIVNVDASVQQNDITLTANATDAEYQWVDCNNNNAPIEGADDQTFEATQNGSYAVQVTQNGCTELSDCFEITTVSVLELGLNQKPSFKLYPNPVQHVLSVDFDKVTEIEIYNVTGKLVNRFVGLQQYRIDVSAYPAGLYVVRTPELSLRFVKP